MRYPDVVGSIDLSLSDNFFSGMSSAIKTSSSTFTETPQTRVEAFLAQHGKATKALIIPLTPDASTRVYFRVPWKRGTAVAAVYPEPFDETVHPYLDVTRLFLECQLPVPEIYEVDGTLGHGPLHVLHVTLEPLEVQVLGR